MSRDQLTFINVKKKQVQLEQDQPEWIQIVERLTDSFLKNFKCVAKTKWNGFSGGQDNIHPCCICITDSGFTSGIYLEALLQNFRKHFIPFSHLEWWPGVAKGEWNRVSAGTEKEIPSYSLHESKNESGYYREHNGFAHISVIYLKDSTNKQKKQQHPNLLLTWQW